MMSWFTNFLANKYFSFIFIAIGISVTILFFLDWSPAETGIIDSERSMTLHLMRKNNSYDLKLPMASTTDHSINTNIQNVLDIERLVPEYENEVDIWTEFQSTASTGGNKKMGRWVRIIVSNGIPSHEIPLAFRIPIMHDPSRPHIIKPQEWRFEIPINSPVLPTTSSTNIVIDQLWGVALDGVPFEPEVGDCYDPSVRGMHSINGFRQWQFDAISGVIDLGFDSYDAHVQVDGAYHYHGNPVYFEGFEIMPSNMLLIGWAFDGYPIYWRYGYTNSMDSLSGINEMQSGWVMRSSRISVPKVPTPSISDFPMGSFKQDYEFLSGSSTDGLDECNGKFGVTPEHPGGTYHYYITNTFPYIPRCHRGKTSVPVL